MSEFDECEVVAALASLADEIYRWRRERDRYLAGSATLLRPTGAESGKHGDHADFVRLLEVPVLGALHNAIILIGERLAQEGWTRADLRRIVDAVALYGSNDGGLYDEHTEFMRRGLINYRWHGLIGEKVKTPP